MKTNASLAALMLLMAYVSQCYTQQNTPKGELTIFQYIKPIYEF